MGFKIQGEIVETESKPWEMNGSKGTSYNLYVSGGRARDGAQRVKVKPEQFGSYQTGDKVDLPVSVFARASDFGGQPRVEVTLDPEYRYSRTATGLHGVAPAKTG
jgi:hypothetical protein